MSIILCLKKKIKMNEETINLKYNGKTYHHLEDFAKDNGISTKTVKDRWFRGHRDPEKLLHRGRIPFKFKGAHHLIYEGKEYPLLIEFCRRYKLNYRKALDLWRRNIRDPEVIKDEAVVQDSHKVLSAVRQNDLSKIEEIVNNYGYLTSAQVAQKTGIGPLKIRDQVTRFLAGQNNNVGLLQQTKIMTIIV